MNCRPDLLKCVGRNTRFVICRGLVMVNKIAGLIGIQSKFTLTKKKTGKYDVYVHDRRVGKDMSKSRAKKRIGEVEWFSKNPDKK